MMKPITLQAPATKRRRVTICLAIRSGARIGILATAAAALMSGVYAGELGPANTPLGKCEPAALILDGIFTHGSVECNKAWLDRPASYIAVAAAKNCRSLPETKAKQYIKRGMLDFNKRVAADGKPAACKALDDIMTTLENRR